MMLSVARGRSRHRLLMIMGGVMCPAWIPLHAEVVTFQQGVAGYSGTVDTYLQLSPVARTARMSTPATILWLPNDRAWWCATVRDLHR